MADELSKMGNGELLLEYGDRSYASGENAGTDEWMVSNALRKKELHAELLRRLSPEPPRPVFSHGTALDFEGEITYLQELRAEGEPSSGAPQSLDKIKARHMFQDDAWLEEKARQENSANVNIGSPSTRPSPDAEEIARFWDEWHEKTFGASKEQYAPFFGWRNVAWQFAEAWASRQHGVGAAHLDVPWREIATFDEGGPEYVKREEKESPK